MTKPNASPRDSGYYDTCPGCHAHLTAPSKDNLVRKIKVHAETCKRYTFWSTRTPIRAPRKKLNPRRIR